MRIRPSLHGSLTLDCRQERGIVSPEEGERHQGCGAVDPNMPLDLLGATTEKTRPLQQIDDTVARGHFKARFTGQNPHLVENLQRDLGWLLSDIESGNSGENVGRTGLSHL